jgi:hypothetical protein
VLSNGNIGISTTTPTSTLTIVGSESIVQPAGPSDYSQQYGPQTIFQAGNYRVNSFNFLPNSTGQRDVTFGNVTKVGGLPGSYVDSLGAWNSWANINVSGHTTGLTNPNAVINPPSVEPSMIDAWSDVNGPTVDLRVNVGSSLERNLTARDVQGEDVFNIGPVGELSWAASGVTPSSTYTSRDVSLSRVAAGTLAVGNGSATSTNGTLVAATIGIGTSAPSTTLQVASASSTVTIGTASLPGCLEMGNSNGTAGLNYITVLNGVLSATTTKPNACQ